MTDKNVDSEIDLVELIILMWKNKWKIFLFFLFSLLMTYIYSLTYDKDKKLYQTKIYINLISETDFLPYDEYNKFVQSYVKREFFFEDMRYQTQLDSEMIFTTAVENYFNKSAFNLIKRKELENLFLKYSTDDLIYKDALKELDLTNKNIRLIFPVKKAYYNDVHPFIEINSENTEKESLAKILDYVEKRSNEEIRNFLYNRFKKSISYEIRNAKFKIEDINKEIEYLENDKLSEVLKKKKELLNTNKNIERLKEIFSNLPIVKSENFYVGKFKIDETKIKHMNRFPLKKNLALFGLIGLFFGIIYVFFINFILRK